MLVPKITEGQELFSSNYLPERETFSVRVWITGQNNKLYHNCVLAYISNGVYVIMREDKHINTFDINKCRLEIAPKL